MTSAMLTNWDKAAILLRTLTPEPNQAVLSQLDPEQSAKLRAVMSDIAKRSDLAEITDEVLREFRERRSQLESRLDPGNRSQENEAKRAAQQYQESAELGGSDASSEDTTGDADKSEEITSKLAGIAAPVLSRVLQAESPRVLVLVLQSLPSDHAAGVLKLIPPEARGAVIAMLAVGIKVAEQVSQCVLSTVLSQCESIGEVRESVSDEDAQVKQLVGILQGVDREERLRLMNLLSEQNEAIAAKIDDCMYDYTDLLRIGDRSLQRILTQTDQKTLAMALKTAPEEIREKVMRNMSERVRAALAEEMEFLSEVTNAKAEAARKDLTAIIRTQDKEGTLVWLES